MPLTEVVADVQTRQHRGEPLAGLIHAEQLGHGVDQSLDAIVSAKQRDLRHRVAQHPCSDRVALGMISIEKAFRRYPFDHLGQLPPQIYRILHTDVEALSTRWVMDVGGVAGKQHASLAVGRRLPCHIGESRDPDWTMDPVVGAVYRDKCLAEITKANFAGATEVLFGHQDPQQAAIVMPAQGMDTAGVVPDSPLRLLGQLDLGDQVARCWIPPGERDAGGFTDQAASAVAANEVLGPERPALGQRDIDAGVVLDETRHFVSIDGYRQLAYPAGQYALDVVLPKSEPVIVPGGKIANVQNSRVEAANLSYLPLRQEPISDTALIENLDRT